MDIAVVGLGRMGSSLARAMVGAGAAVSGFDLSAEARERSARDGVRIHDELRAAVEHTPVVLTSLPTTAAVRAVVLGLGELMPSGGLVIEPSTCHPGFAREAVERLADREVRFVDCPVSGKPPATAMLVGGEEGVLGDAEALIAGAVETLVHLGKPGAGYAVKLLQQYVKYARFLVAAEALTFAEHEGLDVAETIRALEAGTGALPGLATAEEVFRGDSAAVASHAPVATIAKDVELAAAMFDEVGFSSPSFAALAALFQATDSQALMDRPYPEIVSLLAELRFRQDNPC